MGEAKKRITLDISFPVHEQLLAAQVVDGCGPSTRMRVLADLWSQDEELQRRVAQFVREERQTGRRGSAGPR